MPYPRWPFLQRPLRDGHVAERMFHAIDLLVILMPLTGQQHGVALLRQADGTPDGRSAFDDDLMVARRHAAEDFIDDALRILAARVVAGDDAMVGEFLGDHSHHRALTAVAVAAAAEYADQPAAL